MADKPLFELDIESMEDDINRVIKMLDKADKTVIKAATNAMNDITVDGLGKSMRKAPVKTGDLRGSGSARVNGQQVAHIENENVITDAEANMIVNGILDAVLGEIGFNSKYAAAQHERTDFNHPKGGEAKYLESTIKENSNDWIKYLADSMEEALNKGGR